MVIAVRVPNLLFGLFRYHTWLYLFFGSSPQYFAPRKNEYNYVVNGSWFILSRFICVTTDGVWIDEWIYWLLYIYTSLGTTTKAPLLISTFHWSPQHPLSLFPACCVFNSRSLVTDSNSGNFSTPALMSLLSGEYPATEFLSTVNPQL
jgi:hypothetical protein